MIAKAIKGKGFRGALEYDLSKEQGRLIDTNMEGVDPRELAKEFGEIRKLRPNLGKAVLHVSLSAAPGEHLTDAQWREIGQRYLRGMELDHNQYLITRHADTDHEHVHLLVNRIRFDGSVTSDSHDYRRHEVLMREIERDYELQAVVPSIDAQRRAATKGEIEHGLRTGVASTRQRLQQLCDAASQDCPGFTEYASRLEAAGVDLSPVTQLGGSKLSGLSYRLDGVMMKGSDLGKRYSPAGLSKLGVGYVKERDHEAVSRSVERSAIGRNGAADRSVAPGAHRERGAIGGDARAAGPFDGRAGGRDQRDARDDRPAQSPAGRAISEGDPGRDGFLGEGFDDGALRGRTPGRIEPQVDLGHPSGRASDGNDERSPRERILALAGAADDQQHSGRGGDRAPATVRDRSLEAIERQIAAMGNERFDVRIRNVARGTNVTRNWSQQELRRSVPWLKRMNALGHDVGIRPSGPHGLILITNLDRANLLKIRAMGLAPTVTLETSSKEYEAWIKLSQMPAAESTRAAILAGAQRHLKICEVPEDIDAYGYLAGMTNHTAALRNRGPSRFVIARTADGEVAESGKKLVDAIEASYTRTTPTPAQRSNEPNERPSVGRSPQRERGPSR